jgi:glucose-6-phosphate 1-dehydrogenase
MQSQTYTKIKFLVFGVSGDLAKRKILPAIRQFSDAYTNFQTSLLGYSRSRPSELELAKIMGANSLEELPFSVNLQQGEYTDPKFFFDTIASLQPDERLVVYLALPPSIFTDIMRNFCPFSASPIDIIIEKPFSSNSQELKELLSVIDACKLNMRAFFFDHYLFKNEIDFEAGALKEVGETLADSTFTGVELAALEQLDVANRIGYYDKAGAIEDMFPHLYSLLEYSLRVLLDAGNSQLTSALNNLNLSALEPQSLHVGQYASYQSELGEASSKSESPSTTETSFDLVMSSKNQDNSISLEMKSGKKLSEKQTFVSFSFVDKQGQSSILKFNIYPEGRLELWQGANLKQIWQPAPDNRLDHTRVFYDLACERYSRFVKREEAVTMWQLLDKVKDFRKKNNLEIQIY